MKLKERITERERVSEIEREGERFEFLKNSALIFSDPISWVT